MCDFSGVRAKSVTHNLLIHRRVSLAVINMPIIRLHPKPTYKLWMALEGKF